MPALRPQCISENSAGSNSSSGRRLIEGDDPEADLEEEEEEFTDNGDELAFLDAVLQSFSCSEKPLQLVPQLLQSPESPQRTAQTASGVGGEGTGSGVRQRCRIVTNGLLSSSPLQIAAPLPPPPLAVGLQPPANGGPNGSDGGYQLQAWHLEEALTAEAEETEERKPAAEKTEETELQLPPSEPQSPLASCRRRHRLLQMSSCPEPPQLSVSSPDLAFADDNCGSQDDRDVEVNLQRARVFYAMAMRALSQRRDQLLHIQDRLLFFQSARQDCKRRLNLLKKRMAELDTKIDEKVKEFDSSRACIVDQSNSKRLSFDNAQEMLAVAKQCYADRMREIMQERKQTQMQLDEARAALQSLEDESADLELRIDTEGDEAAKRRLRDQLKLVEDRLEAQRRVYEDLEFKELEDQSRVEEEREHLFREVVSQQSDLIHKFKDKEAAIERLSAEARESAARAQSELDELEAERGQVVAGFRREKHRMRVADGKISELQSRLPQPPQQPQWRFQQRHHPQQQQPSAAGWMENPGAIMTSSGYASHRGGGGGRGSPSHWWGISPVSDDSTGGTTDASYQSSLMTASLHEDLHGRFNESPLHVAIAAAESCGTYDNPTSMENSYHAAAASTVTNYGKTRQEETDFAHLPSLTQVGDRTLQLDAQSDQKVSKQKPQGGQQAGQEQAQLQSQQHQHQQMPQQLDGASASEVVKRYQRMGSDSSSGSTVPSLVAVESKDAKKNRPLTRYLPSSDPSFDLREHLLSLGHPLDVLHRQVEVTPCGCRGYLTKQGGKFKSWKKRWFVLDRYRKTFTHFADRSEAKIKGCASFCDIQDAYIDRTQTGKSGGGVSVVSRSVPGKRGAAAAFCVATTERTYRCLAPSPEAMRVWLDAVFTAAEGYLMQTQMLDL